MGINSIIVQEYLESLKEDGELDYLFPILLNLMGFKIIATPRESKGQPQYGKDIIAVGVDSADGIKKRFYFEVKGYSDRNIDDSVLNKKDGIIDSFRAAKNTKYEDSSIPGFDSLPIKYVLVHNGILKMNTGRTLQGFIENEFPEKNFERWGIYELSELFYKYLFSEYLFTDKESLRLFKKTLALLDVPDYDFSDFKKLVDLQIEKIQTIKNGRALKKFFATQNLLATVIISYCKENDNLESSKNCISYLLLRTWGWVLENKIEQRPSIKKEFTKLVLIHYNMLDTYFQKTIDITKELNGLYSENGGSFEEIGYPLRCFEYLNYLIYYFKAQEFFNKTDRNNLRNKQKDLIIEIVQNNEASSRPLLDNHSIAITNIILFFLDSEKKEVREKDLRFLAEYLYHIIENIYLIKKLRNRYPLLNNDQVILTREIVNRNKTKYEDSSTLLITQLFEFCAILGYQQPHQEYHDLFKDDIDLQIAHPNFKEFDIEQLLFKKHMYNEYYVETGVNLKESLDDFKKDILSRTFDDFEFRTDSIGFNFLRVLAHIYFKNEFFPCDWRKHYN